MTKPLQLTIPVMLHSDSEPERFLEAKDRLERLGDSYRVPIEVGVFLPYMPGSSRKSEAFEKQLANQRKYRLPIRLAETGIQRNNSLAYDSSDPTYDRKFLSQLTEVIDQVARLRDLDPSPRRELVVAPHVGILAVPMEEGDFSKPGIYSVEDFVNLKDRLYTAAKRNFDNLSRQAAEKGLVLAIENAYPMAWENASFWQTGERQGTFGPTYQAFNDLRSLLDLSNGNLVLDLAHLVSISDLPNQFARSQNHFPDEMFKVMGIDSWDSFLLAVGKKEDYFPSTRALHISQADGVGVRVSKDSTDAMVWGGAKRLPPLISNAEHAEVLRKAMERDLPVNIEEDYSFNPLNFLEADAFLEPILQELTKFKDLQDDFR